jgi:hypothetical protein
LWRCRSLNEILFSRSTHLCEIYDSRECIGGAKSNDPLRSQDQTGFRTPWSYLG